MKKQKLYCYIDESGQDTMGEMFIVTIVMAGELRDELRWQLEDIERVSCKQTRKWTHSKREHRRAYMESVLENPLFAGLLYYSVHLETRNYRPFTVFSIATAIAAHISGSYIATIFVDGLRRTEQHRFSRELRDLHINTREVRGMDDQADAFIRLADALAGFVRDALAGDELLRPLYFKAMKKKIVRQV